MHMTDALLSPTVGTAFCALSVGAVALTSAKIKRDDLQTENVPLMAVAGAFVFAAQMINFAIPLTGSSGHIAGGALLTSLIGGGPAFLTIAAVLIIQALMFADGGIIALGCNVFNIGVLPCLIICPIVYKLILNKNFSKARLLLSSIIASTISLAFGALFVTLQTSLSGVASLPFKEFAMLMVPIHVAIGILEGVITAAVLFFVYSMRPELLNRTTTQRKPRQKRTVIISLAVIALLVASVLSPFASILPDGLEWSIEKLTGGGEIIPAAIMGGTAIQESIAVMPGYDNGAGLSAAGFIGSFAVFIIAGGTGLIISRYKSIKRKSAAE